MHRFNKAIRLKKRISFSLILCPLFLLVMAPVKAFSETEITGAEISKKLEGIASRITAFESNEKRVVSNQAEILNQLQILQVRFRRSRHHTTP